MLFRYTAQVHAELDAFRTTAEATASTPTFNPTKRHRNNGNGHRAASHFMGETDSSSSEQLGIAAAGGRARLNGKGRSRTI
jgi:hypothetical protein